MTVNQENNIDEEEALLDDDVEALRKRLLELSEQGEIKTTKAFLNNKKKANEKAMKKILNEYLEKKNKQARMELAVSIVSLLPYLIEKMEIIKFKGGADVFSAKILAEENTMFAIADLMPNCQGGETCFRYLSASIFLGTTIYNNVEWFEDTEAEKKPPPKEGVSSSSK